MLSLVRYASLLGSANWFELVSKQIPNNLPSTSFVLLQVIHGQINDMTFISDMESSLRLLQPILAVLQSLEADKPLLSQCLPLWLSVFQHVKAWASAEFQQTVTLESVLLKRFKKCYHPAMSAAYLCDPAYYAYDADSQAYLANGKQVADFEAHLHIDVWKDAKQVSCGLNSYCKQSRVP